MVATVIRCEIFTQAFLLLKALVIALYLCFFLLFKYKNLRIMKAILL